MILLTNRLYDEILLISPHVKHLYSNFNLSEFLTFIQWQVKRLKDLNVNVILNTEATLNMIQDLKADEIILATGGKPFIPPIPGVKGDNVHQANDVLLQNCTLGKNVLVAGGGSVGVETAEYLAVYGHNVTIVEMLDDILNGCERETMLLLRKAIKEYNINIYTSSKLVNIEKDKITLERKGKSIVLEEIDNVVIAAGSRPYNPLKTILEEAGFKVKVVGDALKVTNGLIGIYEGYMAGYTI